MLSLPVIRLTDLGVEPPLNPNPEAVTPVSSDSIRMIDEDDFTSNGAENGKSAPSPRGGLPPEGVILRHGETHHIPTFEDVNRKVTASTMMNIRFQMLIIFNF